MSTSVVSPVFVGRQEEFAALAVLLERVQRGEPAFAVIGGEAGVGKTRLVGELAARAASAGFTVLLGHCIELGAAGLPLAPLIDALRALARSIPPGELADVLGPAGSGLARLLPELAPHGPAPATADEMQASQLMELVLGLLGRLSVAQPVLLVLEDLHWADQSTLELVAFLIRALRGVRVLLVATYRSDELHRRHPLRPLLTGWERMRTVDRLDLVRFERDEVAAQLAAILAAEPGPGLVDLVYDRSGGNAYLVEELAGVVRRGDDPANLPPSLVDVLLSGVDSLSEPAQRLLRTAAAAGRRVPDRLLAAVAGLAEPELFAALREAVESHLLVVDQGGHGYEFRHALTRDAVYEDMLPGERVRLHSAYGEALTADPGLAGDDTAVPAALAHHWYAALDLPRALPASVSAGQAMMTYAPAEAQRHLERALEIWPRVPDAEQRTGLDLAEVIHLAADAAYRAGAVDRSLSLTDQALAELPRGGDPVRQAMALERRARTLRDMGRETEAAAELERALALLPADEVTRAHAVILAALATAVHRTGDRLAAGAVAERAVAAARATGAREAEADALITLGLDRSYRDAGDEGPEAIRAGLAVALELNVWFTALRGYVNLSDVLEFLGRHAEAARVAQEGIALAGRVGLARTLGSYLTGNLAEPLLRLGRWDEVDGLISRALATEPEGIFAATLLQFRAERATMSGRDHDAEEDLRAARRALGQTTDPQFTEPMGYLEGTVALSRGDLAEARANVAGCLPDGPAAWAARYTWPLLWLGVRVEADEAILARDRHQPVPPQSTRQARVLAALAGDLAGLTPPARGYQALVAAEQTRAGGDGDPRSWSAAVTAWEAAGEPYPLAYAWLRLAEGQCAAGDRAGATTSVRQAHVIASRIGADPVAAEAVALARRARLPLDGGTAGASYDPAVAGAAGPAAPPGPGGAGTAEPADELARFGLTDREREVLLLLADGRSNPEIAQALFISPKTASVHVSNILGKLGVSGRVEAAAVLHRMGRVDR